jgi:hypothetical protein
MVDVCTRYVAGPLRLSSHLLFSFNEFVIVDHRERRLGRSSYCRAYCLSGDELAVVGFYNFQTRASMVVLAM